ncbi:MAG: hypothetical protein H6838_00345 [Planctomycetes bacterium]|nr:hypothetical protein [Planctomycetota bacterium]
MSVGLDSVELVLAFEDEFEIRIPDEVAAGMRSIRDVVDFVATQLAAQGRPRDRDLVLAMVYVITADQTGVQLDRLTEDTQFVADLGID